MKHHQKTIYDCPSSLVVLGKSLYVTNSTRPAPPLQVIAQDYGGWDGAYQELCHPTFGTEQQSLSPGTADVHNTPQLGTHSTCDTIHTNNDTVGTEYVDYKTPVIKSQSW